MWRKAFYCLAVLALANGSLMCGIFGIVSKHPIHRTHLNIMARRSERRGKDSSGLVNLLMASASFFGLTDG